MRALYGNKKGKVTNRYVVIYDKYHTVGDPINMRNYTIHSEREVTSFEIREIILSMKNEYRIYHYESAERLVDDELRCMVITPQEVVENFKTNEQSRIS